MSLNHATHKISAEDYLQGEMLAEFKHEYIDGEVYAMVGASELRSQLKGQGQQDFSSIGKGAHGTPSCSIFINVKGFVFNGVYLT